jgi:hypothetical protein
VHGELDEIGNAWSGAVEMVKSAPPRAGRQLVLVLTGASLIGGEGDVDVGSLLRIRTRQKNSWVSSGSGSLPSE